MHDSDKIYFSDFSADPEFESIYDYDELYDFDFNGQPAQPEDGVNLDDSDDFLWDDL